MGIWDSEIMDLEDRFNSGSNYLIIGINPTANARRYVPTSPPLKYDIYILDSVLRMLMGLRRIRLIAFGW